MPNASASIASLFQILEDFSSIGKQAIVATVSLEDANSNSACNVTANMYIGDSEGPQSRRVGFANQYAFVSGAIALCHDSASNALSFEIRGASINTLMTLSPTADHDAIDDTVRPQIIHTISAYHFALHSFSILGTVTTVHGDPGTPARHFTVKTDCWNRQV
jgi:hypothetical protein